jgi:hypothetical protein
MLRELVLDVDAECLLRQMAADLDLSVEETARVLLESALLLPLPQ